MERRARRVYTPETTFDRMVAMAIERGKLGDLLLDNVEGWAPQALARIVQVVEHTPVGPALAAVEPLKSVFLRAVVTAARQSARQERRPVLRELSSLGGLRYNIVHDRTTCSARPAHA